MAIWIRAFLHGSFHFSFRVRQIGGRFTQIIGLEVRDGKEEL